METEFSTFQQSDSPGERVKEDLRALVRDAEELLRATAGDMSEKAKSARTKLAAAIERAKKTCQEKTVAAAKATDRVIREHPYESLGVAFGIGLLIGVLISRK